MTDAWRSWRERAAPIVAQTLRATAGRPEAEVRAALRAAYPFGPREDWPYKVWLDEIRRQRGLPRARPRRSAPTRDEHAAPDRTLDLFDPGIDT